MAKLTNVNFKIIDIEGNKLSFEAKGITYTAICSVSNIYKYTIKCEETGELFTLNKPLNMGSSLERERYSMYRGLYKAWKPQAEHLQHDAQATAKAVAKRRGVKVYSGYNTCTR